MDVSCYHVSLWSREPIAASRSHWGVIDCYLVSIEKIIGKTVV